MEIQTLENIGSDSDITVIMVKNSLKPAHKNAKSGDGRGKSEISLINLATCKQEGNHVSTLRPLSSWDQDSTGTQNSLNPTASSHKTEEMFKISDSMSVDSLVINTIQNAYAESELTSHSELMNTAFVDVNLQESSEKVLKDKVISENRKSKGKNSLLCSCFSCVQKKRPSKKYLPQDN